MARRLSDGVGVHGGAAAATRSRKGFLSLFLAALRRGRGAADLCALRPSSAVKFAADVSMAVAAAGRPWSRSVISQSRKVCPAVVDFIRSCKAKSCGDFRNTKREVSRSNLLRTRKSLYSMERKRSKSRGVRRLNASCRRSMRRMVRAVLRSEEKRHVSKPEIGHLSARVEVLKSLVPGGAAMDTPLLVEEAFHYIEALHTQVESMRALLHYCEDRGGEIHSTSK